MEVLSVTGHRPDKLGGYDDKTFMRLKAFARRQLRIHQPSYVITGMALGWDQAVACACIDSGIRFIAYIPFLGQESVWPEQSQDRYRAILSHAFSQRVICGAGYATYKMHQRNEKMVDDCDELLTLYNGSPGGTGSTVDYALRQNTVVTNCWPDWEKFSYPPRPKRIR